MIQKSIAKSGKGKDKFEDAQKHLEHLENNLQKLNLNSNIYDIDLADDINKKHLQNN